jgi:flagellar biosynthesis GTPase FlhF
MNKDKDKDKDTDTTTNTETDTIELVVKEINSTAEKISNISNIPKFIFIIPYRDREEHKEFFTVYMKHVLEDIPKTDYEIYFVEQKNTLPFNRGAMKNIGFLALKYKYPNDYKNITFVFNDVDTVPYSKNVINYETTPGVVKHYYGFKFALGGIFSIRGEDFERTNGFPNFWSWGGEDNYMQKRVEYSGLYIDRSVFFNILDKNILQLCDGIKRLICRKEAATVVNMTTSDGLITIKNLNYDFKDEYVNVYSFETIRDPRMLRFEEQNIAVESKIRLEKDDVKNLLDRKMNKMTSVYQNTVLPRRPVSAQQQQMQQQHQQQMQQHQQQQMQQQHQQQMQQHQQQQMQQQHQQQMQQQQHQQQMHQQQQQQQHIRKNMYRGIGMGGVR